MITPQFELTQTERTIILRIRAPFARLSETEIDIDGKQITFYSRPYYLRINLPGIPKFIYFFSGILMGTKHF